MIVVHSSESSSFGNASDSQLQHKDQMASSQQAVDEKPAQPKKSTTKKGKKDTGAESLVILT